MDRSAEIQSALINYTREFFDRLNTLWSEMGYDRMDIEARNENAAQHVKKLCGDMIEDQEREKALVIAEIETLLEQADKLEKELKVKINVDVSEIPLLRVKDCLNDRLEQYLIRRAERVEKRASLLKQAGELSLAMGKVDIPNLPQVPSEEELEDLKKLISNYIQEKNQRMETFRGLRAGIITAMESLELEPEVEFERQVIASKKFVLSDNNMIALRELSQTMERRLAETKGLADELREKLSVLWDRLNEAPALREAFLFGYTGIGKDTIAALRAEIARYEELTLANIRTERNQTLGEPWASFSKRLARRPIRMSPNPLPTQPDSAQQTPDSVQPPALQVHVQRRELKKRGMATRSSAKLNTVNCNVTCHNKTPDRNATYSCRCAHANKHQDAHAQPCAAFHRPSPDFKHLRETGYLFSFHCYSLA